MSDRSITRVTAAPALQRQGRRYVARERARAVEYARGRLGDGAPLKGIARELGISVSTLERWMRVCAFVPVEVPTAPTRAFVVHGPAGLRIEGLALADLAELVRRLA